MFIREVKKQRNPDSKVFYQYNLVQSSRVDGKVKQRIILYLGSDPILRDKDNRRCVLLILKAKIFKQPSFLPQNAPEEITQLAAALYDKYLVKYGTEAEGVPSKPAPEYSANYHKVDIDSIETREVRSFGAENLCTQVMEKLQFRHTFNSLGFSKDQTYKAMIAIAARAIFASSDHNTSKILSTNSSLNECMGYKPAIDHKDLYAISDLLYKYQEQIDSRLYKRINTMFELEDRLVIFDLSNTYFETSKPSSKLAQFYKSKEKRNDCPVVVFTGVINKDGFMRHTKIYKGNTPDMETVGQMLDNLEKHSEAHKKKTVVMDAGIATEDNLKLIRKRGYDYVCVSRKRLKDYPLDEKNNIIRKTSRGRLEVALRIFQPDEDSDTWMYVQSEEKRKKEESIRDKLSKRFEEDLGAIQAGLNKKGGTKKIEKVWERIGRAKEKNKRVSSQYSISVAEKEGIATQLRWERKNNPVKQDKERGVYFIRTSYNSINEADLWDIYNTIREVESTFRCLKSELKIRPVYHQKDSRIESHIYLTILAYQLVNTIRYMLKNQKLNYSWSTILRLLSTQIIQTIEVPTDTKRIFLRKPSSPIKEVSEIYQATSCKQTIPQKIKYVVYH